MIHSSNVEGDSQESDNLGAPGFERPELLTNSVYKQLKAMILTNQFRPGESLVEGQIAKQWQVSRTPVRAALTRLDREGLVRTFPHKGFVVTEIAPTDVVELYQVRVPLEVVAIQLATPRFTDDELDELAQLFANIDVELEAGRYDAYIPSDEDFHNRIISHVPNRRLTKILDGIRDELGRIRNFAHEWPGDHMREAHREHVAILAAMRRRDPEASGEAMRRHLQNVSTRTISLLQLPASQGGGNDATD